MQDLSLSVKKQAETLLVETANVFIKAKLDISNRFKGINWQYFAQLAAHHDIKIPVFIALKKYFPYLPKDYADLFTSDYVTSLNRNAWLFQSFLELCRIFNQNNIPFAPIKGIGSTIDLYKNKPLRNMLDIDILVKKEDFKNVERILLGSGYSLYLKNGSENYWKERHFQVSYVKGPLLIDLHTGLGFNINSGRRMDIVKQEKLWKRIKLAEIDGVKVPLLSPEDSIIVIALHQQRFGNILRFKELCDFALLIKKYGESLNFAYLEEAAYRNGLNTCLYYIFRWHNNIFPAWSIKRHKGFSRVSFIRKKTVDLFLSRNGLGLKKNEKLLYLQVFFIVSDRISKALECILFVPYEQFCKFFSLPLYTSVSRRLYILRFVYMPLSLISILLRKTVNAKPGKSRKTRKAGDEKSLKFF